MHEIVTKIREGTKSDSTDLCVSCRSCLRIRGAADSEETRYCHAMEKTIKGRVAECSSYYNHNLPSLKTLYETAYILDTSKATIGFVPYQKWNKQNPDRNYIPDDY